MNNVSSSQLPTAIGLDIGDANRDLEQITHSLVENRDQADPNIEKLAEVVRELVAHQAVVDAKLDALTQQIAASRT